MLTENEHNSAIDSLLWLVMTSAEVFDTEDADPATFKAAQRSWKQAHRSLGQIEWVGTGYRRKAKGR